MKGEKCPFVTQLRYATSFLVSEIIDSQLSSWICLKKSCGKFKMSSLFLLGEMGSPYTSIDFESKMSKKNQFFIQKWSWNGLGVFPQVMGVLLVEFLNFRFLNRNFMTYMICFFSFFFQIFRNDIFVCRISSFMFSEYLLNGEWCEKIEREGESGRPSRVYYLLLSISWSRKLYFGKMVYEKHGFMIGLTLRMPNLI